VVGKEAWPFHARVRVLAGGGEKGGGGGRGKPKIRSGEGRKGNQARRRIGPARRKREGEGAGSLRKASGSLLCVGVNAGVRASEKKGGGEESYRRQRDFASEGTGPNLRERKGKGGRKERASLDHQCTLTWKEKEEKGAGG